MRLARERRGKSITLPYTMHNHEYWGVSVNLIDLNDVEIEMQGFNNVILLAKFRYRRCK